MPTPFLAERLKTLRAEAGWSQGELADKSDSDGRQVSRYENGRITPSLEALVRIPETSTSASTTSSPTPSAGRCTPPRTSWATSPPTSPPSTTTTKPPCSKSSTPSSPKPNSKRDRRRQLTN